MWPRLEKKVAKLKMYIGPNRNQRNQLPRVGRIEINFTPIARKYT